MHYSTCYSVPFRDAGNVTSRGRRKALMGGTGNTRKHIFPPITVLRVLT